MYQQLVRLLLTGIGLGIIVPALKLAWARYGGRQELPPALLITIAFWIGQTIVRPLSYSVWIATVILAASCLVDERSKKRRIPVHLTLFFGAAVLAFGAFPTKDFRLPAFLVLAILLMIPALTRLDRSSEGSGLIPLILPVTVGGIASTVPDTEGAIVLFGILIPALVFVLKPVRVFFGSLGGAPFAGMLMWMIFESGKGRPASVIVSAGCLGVLIVKPILTMITCSKGASGTFIWFVLHCASVSIAIGLARTTSSLTKAAGAACAAILISLFAALLLSRVTKAHSEKTESKEV